MAHTPGPWIADDFEVRNESGELVAEVNYILDAHLTAAAPDGYEILKDIAACVLSAGECRITNDAQFKRILDYLAKAEGRDVTHE